MFKCSCQIWAISSTLCLTHHSKRLAKNLDFASGSPSLWNVVIESEEVFVSSFVGLHSQVGVYIVKYPSIVRSTKSSRFCHSCISWLFGSAGEGYRRLAFASSLSIARKALERAVNENIMKSVRKLFKLSYLSLLRCLLNSRAKSLSAFSHLQCHLIPASSHSANNQRSASITK